MMKVGAIQSLCSTLSNEHYPSAIPEPFTQHQYQDAFVQYTQGYNSQISDAPKLMINIMLECSWDFSQQFYPLLAGVTYVLQSLRSTHSLITHVLQGLFPKILSFTCWGYLCAPELTINTQPHNPCARGIIPNTSQKSILYIRLMHNTSQKDHLSVLGRVPNHIINKSSTSIPIPSTQQQSLYHKAYAQYLIT